MLKLKFQYFGHVMRRTDSMEKADAGKNWRQEENGMTEDEMVGCHHGLDGHEFKQAPGVGDGQGNLVCCMHSMGSQRVGCDWATELNWTELSEPHFSVRCSSLYRNFFLLGTGLGWGNLGVGMGVGVGWGDRTARVGVRGRQLQEQWFEFLTNVYMILM